MGDRATFFHSPLAMVKAEFAAFGGSAASLLDSSEPLIVETPWRLSGRQRLARSEATTVGGGVFLSSTRLLVWRGGGRWLWLREASLVADEEVEARCVAVEVASELLQAGAIAAFAGPAKATVCVACAGHVCAVELRQERGSYLSSTVATGAVGGWCVELDAFAGLSRQPTSSARVWTSEAHCFVGCGDGGVARLDAAHRKWRRVRDAAAPGVGRRLLTRALLRAEPEATDTTVVALCATSGAVLALRADASLAGWALDTLAQTVAMSLEDEASPVTTASRMAANDRACVVVPATSSTRTGRQVVVDLEKSRVVSSTVLGEAVTAVTLDADDRVWAVAAETGALWTTDLASEPASHGPRGRGIFDDDEELGRKCRRVGWGKYFDDDWARASAAIERFYLRRLARPRRFSPKALRRALSVGLPEVLRQEGGSADDALAACRAWYRLVAAEAAKDMEEQCERLVECWRQLVQVVEAQAAEENRPLGFAIGSSSGPPPLVYSGRISLVACFYQENENDPLSRAASGLAGAQELAAYQLAVDDAVSKALRSSTPDADYLRRIAASHARRLAANHYRLAVECAETLAGDRGLGLSEAVAAPEGHASALVAAAAVDCAAAHARRTYGYCRDALLAVAVADCARDRQSLGELASDLEAQATRWAVAAWVCSCAAPDDTTFPAANPAIEALPLATTAIATPDVRAGGEALARACQGDGDLGRGAFAAARAATVVARLPVAVDASDVAVAGAALANLAEASVETDARAAERAWYAAVCHDATLETSVVDCGRIARAAFFFHRRDEGDAARRVARHLLEGDDARDFADLEARLFELSVGPELDDLASAFLSTSKSPERFGRLARSACDRGRLGDLVELPFGPEEATVVEECLERLARRSASPFEADDDDVDYAACLYAWRCRRCDFAGAARGLATREPTLGARLAAHNLLCLLPEGHAFVHRDGAVLSGRDLARSIARSSAELALGSDRGDDQQPLGDLVLALARRHKHEVALDLILALPRTNRTPDALGLVFASLAKRCADVDEQQTPEELEPIDLASPFTKAAEPPYPGDALPFVAFGPPSKPAYDLLHRLLLGLPRDTTFACAKAAAHAFLANGKIHLPGFLADTLVGHHPDAHRTNADPAALVRLYLKFDLLKPALDLLADLIRRIHYHNHAGLACAPFSHIDDVLRRAAKRDELAPARTKLLALLDKYLASLAADHHQQLARKVLATTHSY